MKIQILLIEDNEADSRLVKELLFNAHPGRFTLTPVVSLQEGLSLLLDHTFDIVLTDLNLPDSDGQNTVTYIQDINSTIPIIVLSGCDDEHIAKKNVQRGAQDYLIKGQGDGYLISRAIDYSIERKRHERGLNYLAHYDSLTGLANRLLFRERLDRAIIRADRNKTLVALYVIDLDRFKNVNDNFGHDAGDKLLVEVASRLTKCVRKGDTVARLGGDEFTIIMEDVKNFEDTRMIAYKILEIMKNPINISSNDIYTSPSIGVSVYPNDSQEPETLMKNADNAMYRAKENGRNNFSFYTSDLGQAINKKINMEAKLRRAVDCQEFILHYQPKLTIDRRELIGAEALIRWHQPQDGMVPPALFIPLAEEFGLINAITDWVIIEACKQNFIWQKEGFQPIRMAINLSPKLFNQENIASTIYHQINSTALSPQYVEFELTEGALMQDVEKNNEVLRDFKNMGIHISIDDFGTGYSSLSYLKKFYLDTLKIDQSFVKNIQQDPDNAAIVSAIIAMAKSLRLDVIAEGVETEEQLNLLYSMGCNKAQGYFFSKPVAASNFTQFLKSAIETTPIV